MIYYQKPAPGVPSQEEWNRLEDLKNQYYSQAKQWYGAAIMHTNDIYSTGAGPIENEVILLRNSALLRQADIKGYFSEFRGAIEDYDTFIREYGAFSYNDAFAASCPTDEALHPSRRPHETSVIKRLELWLHQGLSEQDLSNKAYWYRLAYGVLLWYATDEATKTIQHYPTQEQYKAFYGMLGQLGVQLPPEQRAFSDASVFPISPFARFSYPRDVQPTSYRNSNVSQHGNIGGNNTPQLNYR